MDLQSTFRFCFYDLMLYLLSLSRKPFFLRLSTTFIFISRVVFDYGISVGNYCCSIPILPLLYESLFSASTSKKSTITFWNFFYLYYVQYFFLSSHLHAIVICELWTVIQNIFTESICPVQLEVSIGSNNILSSTHS